MQKKKSLYPITESKKQVAKPVQYNNPSQFTMTGLKITNKMSMIEPQQSTAQGWS